MPRPPSVPAPPSAAPPSVDGRTARRERGRLAVIDAVVDLLHEGFAPPATADVTERAGVSEATLFRYFESIDDLQLQATERFLATHAHLFDIPREGVGDRSARIDRFVKARSTLWATIAPVARLGRARAFDHPGMDAFLRSARRSQYEQIARHFAPELAERSAAGRDDLVAAIATLTSFEAFDVQWRDLERTPTQVRRAWRTALRALLGDEAGTTPAGPVSDEAVPATRAPSGSSRP